jgi:hypothetical protein
MVACRISQQLLPQLEEADMNDLLTWFSQQHHGLGTFRIFQRKLEDLLENEPEHGALYRSNVVGRYVDAFDEKPLPVAVADRAYQCLLDLVASLNLQASTDCRLADLNRVAACEFWH